MTEDRKPEEMTFEECLGRLNELVEMLEHGGLDLDRSIEVYEQAVVIRDRCRSILTESERRVQKLMETADGLKTADIPADRS